MAAKHTTETIDIPASGQIQLNLVVRSANQTLYTASYGLILRKSADVMPAPDKKLREAWEQVKRRIEQYEIQSWQISRWFMRHHEIDADLDDLTSETLPAKFTVAQLKGFCESVDRHLSQR